MPLMALVWMLCLVSMLVNPVWSYGSGAPDTYPQPCEDLTPGHGYDPQESSAPYEIIVSSNEYYMGSSIDVTLKGIGEEFKGFLIQGRRYGASGNHTIGNFEIGSAPAKITCTGSGGDAVTQSSSASKSNITVTWHSPYSGSGEGDIEFRTTVVMGYTTYWVDLRSERIKDKNTDFTGTSSTGTTDVQPTQTTQEPLGDIDLDVCGSSKGCFRNPTDCTWESCDYIVTWRKDGDSQIAFELAARDDSAIGWAALGFSHDKLMGDDSVIDCIHNRDTGAIEVQMSYNYDYGSGAKTNTPLNDKHLGLVVESLRGSYADGMLQCRFTRLKSVQPLFRLVTLTELDKVYDLDDDYYLMIGRGPVHSGNVKSIHTELPVVSDEQINVVEDGYIDVDGSTPSYPLVQVHGCLMMFAWMVFASFAILMPRYFKPAWAKRTFKGKAIWFQIHQPCMYMVFLMTITAFIVIFIEAQGFTWPDKKISRTHPILGMFVTTLVIANPIMAYFRPHPNTPMRPLFNWAHFLVGTTAHITAVITICLGLYMTKANMPEWTQWIMLGFILWHILVEITLAFHHHYPLVKAADPMEVSANNSDSNVPVTDVVEEKTEPKVGSRFKTVLVCTHLAVSFVLALILVIVLCTV